MMVGSGLPLTHRCLQFFRLKACVFCDASEHARPKLLLVVGCQKQHQKSPDEVQRNPGPNCLNCASLHTAAQDVQPVAFIGQLWR